MINILEWVDAKGNKLNSPLIFDYKDKFEAMINYHIAHLPADVINHEIKTIAPDRFHYSETIGGAESPVERDVVGVITKDGNWLVIVLYDGNVEQDYKGIKTGIKDLLHTLEKANVFVFPPRASKEYQNLLAEGYSVVDDFMVYKNLWN